MAEQCAAPHEIVIVDDDELSREYLVRLFRKAKSEVRWFSDGDEALAYLRCNRPRALFVDQRMPKLDGIELLAMLNDERGLPPEGSYLCSAAALAPEIRARCTALGVTMLQKSALRQSPELRALVQGSGTTEPAAKA